MKKVGNFTYKIVRAIALLIGMLVLLAISVPLIQAGLIFIGLNYYLVLAGLLAVALVPSLYNMISKRVEN